MLLWISLYMIHNKRKKIHKTTEKQTNKHKAVGFKKNREIKNAVFSVISCQSTLQRKPNSKIHKGEPLIYTARGRVPERSPEYCGGEKKSVDWHEFQKQKKKVCSPWQNRHLLSLVQVHHLFHHLSQPPLASGLPLCCQWYLPTTHTHTHTLISKGAHAAVFTSKKKIQQDLSNCQ